MMIINLFLIYFKYVNIQLNYSLNLYIKIFLTSNHSLLEASAIL